MIRIDNLSRNVKTIDYNENEYQDSFKIQNSANIQK